MCVYIYIYVCVCICMYYEELGTRATICDELKLPRQGSDKQG